jgi:tetratricopeptide (TPR) repeat protein
MLTLSLPKDDFKAAIQAEDAINRLVELGLIRVETNNALRLHRLVVTFVRNAGANEINTAQEAIETAVFEEAERLNQAANPAQLLAWQVHLRAVTNSAFDRDDERAARLCHVLGEHFRQIGDYTRAQISLERALAIRQQVLGEEHDFTARSLTDLGIVLYAQDNLDAARSYYERALAIQQRHLGQHSDTATTLNHLGYLLQWQGELDKAQACHEQALAIRQKTMGEEHPFLAHSLCNLAYLHYIRQDYDGARSYLEKALAVQEKVWGEQHSETAGVLIDLGELLLAQKEITQAYQILVRALTIQQNELGAEHPETARVLNRIGEVLQAQGDLSEAQQYYERALEIYNDCGFDADHRHMRRVLDDLESITNIH